MLLIRAIADRQGRSQGLPWLGYSPVLFFSFSFFTYIFFIKKKKKIPN
jgi:hypothetical protein